MSVSVHKRNASEYTSIIKEDSQREGGSLKLKLIKKIKYEPKNQKKAAINENLSKDTILKEKFQSIEALTAKIEKLEFTKSDLVLILANLRDLLASITPSNSKFIIYYKKLYTLLDKLNITFNLECPERKKLLLKLCLTQQSYLAELIYSLIDTCQNTLYYEMAHLTAPNDKVYNQREVIKWLIESYEQLFIYISSFIKNVKISLHNKKISQNVDEYLTKILNSLINTSYLLLNILTKGKFSYSKHKPNDQNTNNIEMDSTNLSGINNDYNVSVHLTRLCSNILIKILVMSSPLVNSNSTIIQSLGTKIQNAFIILATNQEPRIRDLALQNLLKLHQTMECKLLPHVYELVTIASNDDVESIRQTAIVLLHQVAVTYPSKTTSSGGASNLDLNDIRAFSLRSLNSPDTSNQIEIFAKKIGTSREKSSLKSVDKNEEENTTDQLTVVSLMDDAFYKLCRVMVNDISSKVRAQAVKLLAFPHDSDPYKWTEIGNGNDIPTGSTLWPLTQGRVLLEQALDKRTLMSNMRRKRTYHERAMAGYVSGQGSAVTKDDKPLENLAQSSTNACPEISAEAGAFVHGLEDECSLVRTLTIESMAELARLNRELMYESTSESSVSPDFNSKVVDYLVDMFNDEIVEVRLKAIEALAKIGGPARQESASDRGTAVSYRTDQVEIILGALEDSSGDIREALRKMLGQCRVNDVASVALLVRHLLLNLNKYPQDFYSICECFRDFGAHHSVLIQALIPDLLCTSSYGTLYFSGDSLGPGLGAVLGSACWDFEFDPVEPDVTEDRSYVCVLALLLNALFNCHHENSPCYVQLPSYVLDRHYPYLKDTYPALFRNVKATSAPLDPSISNVDLGTSVQTPTMLVSHLRDNLVRDRLLKCPVNAQSPLESIIRFDASIINDCDRLARLLSQTQGATLALDGEGSYDGLSEFIRNSANFIAIIFKIRLALIPHVHSIVNGNTTSQQQTISLNELRKIKCLIFRAYYQFRGLSKGLRQQLRILKLYVLAIWTRLGQRKDGIVNKNCTNAFIQLLKDELPQYRGDLLTFITDPIIANQYLFSTDDLGQLLIDLLEKKKRAKQTFGKINCIVVNPPAKPSDVPRRFVAGLNLAVATEIIITSSFQPVIKHDKEQDTEFAAIEDEPFEMDNIYKYLKLKVVYPDNRVDYIHIPRSHYKMLAQNRLRIETNVYLASEKAWTDPSNVDFSVVFHLDSSLENIHIVNELRIEDWMEYLTLTSPTRLYVQPRAIGNK